MVSKAESSDAASTAPSTQPLIPSEQQRKKQSVFTRFSRRSSSSKSETEEDKEARLQREEEQAAHEHQKAKEAIIKYRGLSDAQAEEYLENKKKKKNGGMTGAQFLNAIMVPGLSQRAVT